MRGAGPILLIAALLAPPALAQTERDTAQERRETVERRLDVAAGAQAQTKAQAARLERDLARLRQDIKQASDALRARRREAAAAAEAVAAAAEEAEAAEAAIAKRRRELAGLLGAMARLTSRPPEALAALREGPAEAAKASLALTSLLPEIERRIGEARAELREAAALKQVHLAKQADAKAASDALRTERIALDRAVAERRKVLKQTEAQDAKLTRELSRLAGEANTLDAFIEALTAREAAVAAARSAKAARDAAVARARRAEAARAHAAEGRPRPAQTPEPPAATATPAPAAAPPPRGDVLSVPPIKLAGLGRSKPVSAPVEGRISAGYGQGEGLRSQGIVYAASPGAEVFAPYDGKIVYAGSFKGYGRMALIDHGGGYHTLLTGLSRMDVVAGDWVLQGEPLGVLPGGLLAGPSGAGAPKLYVEVRKNGKPVDPSPWFARPT